MKILPNDIFDNWELWSGKNIMEKDLFAQMNQKKYVLCGMVRKKKIFKLLKKDGSIISVPSDKIDYIELLDPTN